MQGHGVHHLWDRLWNSTPGFNNEQLISIRNRKKRGGRTVLNHKLGEPIIVPHYAILCAHHPILPLYYPDIPTEILKGKSHEGFLKWGYP